MMRVADRRDGTGIAADRGQAPGRGQPHEAGEDPNLNPGQTARIPSQHSKAPPAPLAVRTVSSPHPNPSLTHPPNPGKTLPSSGQTL